MSADNWARCPRCTARREDHIKNQEIKVAKLYGVVSVKEFDEARKKLDAERAAELPTSFREDYEIRGAATGVVTVSYGGTCEDCGLTLSFTEEHVIPDWNRA